jgi:hypothetical protein
MFRFRLDNGRLLTTQFDEFNNSKSVLPSIAVALLQDLRHFQGDLLTCFFGISCVEPFETG